MSSHRSRGRRRSICCSSNSRRSSSEFASGESKLRVQDRRHAEEPAIRVRFLGVFALLCGVSALYGGEFGRGTAYSRRESRSFEQAVRSRAGILKLPEERPGLSTWKSPRSKCDRTSSRASWRRKRMPLRLRRQRLAKRLRRDRRLMANVFNLQSVSRLAAKSTKPQSHKTRFTDTGLSERNSSPISSEARSRRKRRESGEGSRHRFAARER